MSVFGEVFDVTIIGAGPVGLYAGIYAGKRDLRVKIIESQPFAGGRLTAHYPDKVIYDVAGHPSIVAKDLVDNLEAQCKEASPDIFYNQKVDGIQRDDQGIWTISTKEGDHRSKAIIVASGIGAFIPDKLDLKSAATLEGKSIFYNVEKLEKFKDKRVLIVGTGDHAYPWAVKVAEVARSVTLAHRLNHLHKPGDLPDVEDLDNLTVKFPFYELAEIHGEETFEGATIHCSSTGETERVNAEALVLNIGSIVNLNLLREWGLALGENSIKVNESMSTNLPGVFAAGDIVTHPGKIKLISTGAGEAAIAVNAATQWLESDEINQKRKQTGAERMFESGGIFYSAFEAVKVAILLEEEALRFYQIAFEVARNKGAKQTFAKLQRSALDTSKLLMEHALPVYSSYANEDLDDTATSYLKSEAAKQLFAGANLAKEAQKNKGSDLQNIYTAIRVEEDIRAFLSKLIEEEKLAKTRSIFSEIATTKEKRVADLRVQQAQLMDLGVAE